MKITINFIKILLSKFNLIANLTHSPDEMMMKNYLKTRFCFSVVLLIICVIHSDALCGETLIFGTNPIPRMVVDDQHGVFVELTRTIAERANLDIEIIVVPVKRALAYFHVQKFDVLFPGLDVYFPPENPPIKSEELITVKHDFVFTRKGTPLLRTLQELEGKRVGITLGYPYARALVENPLIMLEEAPADENNTKKLIAGRIDAFVVEERTGMQAFINTGLRDEMQYDRTSPIAHQNVYYAFQNTDGGKQLAEIVSRTLSEMKADGAYAEIMRKGDTAPQE